MLKGQRILSTQKESLTSVNHCLSQNTFPEHIACELNVFSDITLQQLYLSKYKLNILSMAKIYYLTKN